MSFAADMQNTTETWAPKLNGGIQRQQPGQIWPPGQLVTPGLILAAPGIQPTLIVVQLQRDGAHSTTVYFEQWLSNIYIRQEVNDACKILTRSRRVPDIVLGC